MKVLAVAGTGTDVGKTYVTAEVLRALHARGDAITARKPVQSFAEGDASTDADVLAQATGVAPTDVCPPHRWIPLPLAPPMASDALDLPPFTIADLVAETRSGAPDDTLVIVETAGGVRSPIAADGDCVDFIDALTPDVVLLVADAGLGTINVVRMSITALGPHRVVVYLNRFDPDSDLHARNAQWLTQREGLVVFTDIETLTTFVAQAYA